MAEHARSVHIVPNFSRRGLGRVKSSASSVLPAAEPDCELLRIVAVSVRFVKGPPVAESVCPPTLVHQNTPNMQQTASVKSNDDVTGLVPSFPGSLGWFQSWTAKESIRHLLGPSEWSG